MQDVVEALFNLRNDHIKFLFTEAETQRCTETFQNVSDLPNIVGAIDGSHIRISAPPDSAVDYFSCYQQHDFIVQAIVDGRKRFLDFGSGFPGSIHDARVLRNSTIFASWLQKPFPEATRDPEEIAFNKALSGARVAVGCAFGMLKNRWRILGKRLDSKASFANKITVACTVLHNFCLLNQDEWDDD